MSLRKNNGSILVTIIIYFSIFSLLLAVLLKVVLRFATVTDLRIAKENGFYTLENIAKTVLKSNNCMVNMDDPNKIVNELKNTKGCNFYDKDKVYKFFIEDLGYFPCLNFHNTTGSLHKRVTVLSPSMKVLQIRYAFFNDSKQFIPCPDPVNLSSAILSWRYISL